MTVTLFHYCDYGHQNTLVCVRSKQDPHIIDQLIYTILEESVCERIYITGETYPSGKEYFLVYSDDDQLSGGGNSTGELEYYVSDRMKEKGFSIDVLIDYWMHHASYLEREGSTTLQELEPIGFFDTDKWHRTMSKCKIRPVEYPESTSKA